jgi:hypothetical protein
MTERLGSRFRWFGSLVRSYLELRGLVVSTGQTGENAPVASRYGVVTHHSRHQGLRGRRGAEKNTPPAEKGYVVRSFSWSSYDSHKYYLDCQMVFLHLIML